MERSDSDGGAEGEAEAQREGERRVVRWTVDEIVERSVGHELYDGDGVKGGAAEKVDEEGGGRKGGKDCDFVGGEG